MTPLDSTQLDRSCPICRDGRPLDVVGELPSVWVTAPAAAPLPGYVCVVSKRHVVEPFHLSDAESAAFWADCIHVSTALDAALQPSKMNYEIHGNTIPHLHLHLYPRYPGDPYAGRPIDGRSTQFERSQEDLDRIRRAIAP